MRGRVRATMRVRVTTRARRRVENGVHMRVRVQVMDMNRVASRRTEAQMLMLKFH